MKKLKATKKKPKIIVLQSLTTLKSSLDRIFKKKIRLRDCDENGYGFCISCEKVIVLKKDFDAGHYIPCGKTAFLRWHNDNVNGQCVNCNHFQSSNPLGYRSGIIKKYGKETEEYLYANRNKKFIPSRQWLEDRIEQEKLEVKELLKTKNFEY